jgi:hypothetical protein
MSVLGLIRNARVWATLDDATIISCQKKQRKPKARMDLSMVLELSLPRFSSCVAKTRQIKMIYMMRLQMNPTRNEEKRC